MLSVLKWFIALLVTVWISPAFAGTSLTAGGVLNDAADGTESVASVIRVFRTTTSDEVASITSDEYAAETWVGEIGLDFSDYQVDDELIAVAELSINQGQFDHAGYYAVQSTTLDGSDPVQFSEMTLRPIPVPQVSLQPGYIANISWQEATEDGTGNIIGYRLWRSSDGISFTEIASVDAATTVYQELNFPVDNRYYALSLVYRNEVSPEAQLLSASSADSQDTDGDAIPNSIDTDDDGDGLTDTEEVACGADPLEPTDQCPRGMPWLMLLLDDD